MMMLTGIQKFTIEEIRNYISSKDSLGDVLHYLSEKNIVKANETKQDELDYDEETEDDHGFISDKDELPF